MKKHLMLTACLASLMLPSGAAWAIDNPDLQVSRLGDVELSCGALSREAVHMRDIIAHARHIKNGTEMKGHGITAAGAVGSLLIGTATGGVGLAAAGFLLSQENKETAEQAIALQETAQQRRALMMGIFNAKGCNGPLDSIEQAASQKTVNTDTRIAAMQPASGNKTNKNLAARKPQYNQ